MARCDVGRLMARRKKTALLKTDLEDLVSRLERLMSEQVTQTDAILANLPEDKRAYYYGRRTALTGLSEFVTAAKATYLD